MTESGRGLFKGRYGTGFNEKFRNTGARLERKQVPRRQKQTLEWEHSEGMFNVMNSNTGETENSPHTARQTWPPQASSISLVTVGSKMEETLY
jgi:hypothetical protein